MQEAVAALASVAPPELLDSFFKVRLRLRVRLRVRVRVRAARLLQGERRSSA